MHLWIIKSKLRIEEVSMFKVGEAVVLKNSSQYKVMKIQAYK